MFAEGELQHPKYERSVGKEKIEWPVTQIVVRSLKKLDEAETNEDTGVLADGSEFRKRDHRYRCRLLTRRPSTKIEVRNVYGGLRLDPTTRMDSQSAGRESKSMFSLAVALFSPQ